MYKRINKIKLAITTDCNLSCDYCFVKKTKETMDLATAQKAVDLLIQAEGRDKLLSIYGGEALLNFGLLEELCPYAAAEGSKSNKNLTITVCTNSTLLTKAHLSLFKKYNLKLIISMAGDRISHDRFRKFYNRKGSYGTIKRRLPLVFESIPPENIGVAFCIFPSLVDKIEKNFQHLIGLGFRYVNFEIIRDFQAWSPEKIRRFVLELNKVIKNIFRSASKNNFIFLNPINWEIKYRTIRQSLGVSCPFHYKLEVYPAGEMAFSPFLLNSVSRQRYIIGNINKPVLKRFDDCRFSLSNNRCRECESLYFKSCADDRGASQAYSFYQLCCSKAAEEIKDSVAKSRPFDRYVEEIRKKFCF